MRVLGVLDYEPLIRIHLAPLAVVPHGIATAVGFFAGYRHLLPAARLRGMTHEFVASLVVRCAAGAIIGARFLYVVNSANSASTQARTPTPAKPSAGAVAHCASAARQILRATSRRSPTSDTATSSAPRSTAGRTLA